MRLRAVQVAVCVALAASCQHSAQLAAAPADAGTATWEIEIPEEVRVCAPGDVCVVVPLIPDGGRGVCRVAVNRAKVSEFYELIVKPNEADFRMVDSLSLCSGASDAVCSHGLCRLKR